MHIYLLKCNSFYKIGIARDPKKRHKDLQIGNPYPIYVLKTWRFTGNTAYRFAKKSESFFHRAFSVYKERGEWYRLSDSDIEQIDKVCIAVQTGIAKVAVPVIEDFKCYVEDINPDFCLVAECEKE